MNGAGAVGEPDDDVEIEVNAKVGTHRLKSGGTFALPAFGGSQSGRSDGGFRGTR